MTPKEKAKELVDLHHNGVRNRYQKDYNVVTAKKSAHITINEILENLEYLCVSHLGTYLNPRISFWQDVKKEIDKL